MFKGKVRWFNNQKRYGFITDSEGKDVFVHYSAIQTSKKFQELHEGQTVEFEITDGEKGKQAINVTVVVETTKEDFEKMMDTINSSAQKVLNGEA